MRSTVLPGAPAVFVTQRQLSLFTITIFTTQIFYYYYFFLFFSMVNTPLGVRIIKWLKVGLATITGRLVKY